MKKIGYSVMTATRPSASWLATVDVQAAEVRGPAAAGLDLFNRVTSLASYNSFGFRRVRLITVITRMMKNRITDIVSAEENRKFWNASR